MAPWSQKYRATYGDVPLMEVPLMEVLLCTYYAQKKNTIDARFYTRYGKRAMNIIMKRKNEQDSILRRLSISSAPSNGEMSRNQLSKFNFIHHEFGNAVSNG